MEKILFEDMETGESVEFFVLEQTTLNEKNYLLVTDADPDDDEANAFIFERIIENNGDPFFFVHMPCRNDSLLTQQLFMFMVRSLQIDDIDQPFRIIGLNLCTLNPHDQRVPFLVSRDPE